MKKLVVIGIPIYKPRLNDFEKISLQQLKAVLGRYPLVFIAPETLQFQYGAEYNHFTVERFPEQFFQNTTSYSQLLLSKEFYQRFGAYEFLLIYQLDAFVFSDQLEAFCQMNFDYIGAPIPRYCWPQTELFSKYKKSVVGNGGVSLRKIKSMIQILDRKEDIYSVPFLEKEFNKAEDLFFSFCGSKRKFAFKVPSVRVASQFSIEHAFGERVSTLPFACHAWHKLHFDKWKPHIETYGYQLDALRGENLGQTVLQHEMRIFKGRLSKYLSRRIIRAGKRERLRLALGKYINLKMKYRIWGGGEDGRRCAALLKCANITIECIYDSKSEEGQSVSGIVLRQPSEHEIKEKGSMIIIATKAYGQEIADRLISLGLEREADFLLFDEIEQAIIKAYYSDA